MSSGIDEVVKQLVRALRSWSTRPWWLVERDPYRVLIGVLLANRTDYRIVRRYLPGFITRYPCIEALASTSLDELAEALKPFGLYRARARMLKELAARIEEIGGLDGFLELGPSEARKLLLGIPGIGEKTADILLAALFGVDVFVVDTHILRIAKRLGIVPENYDIYRARKLLEPLIPPGERIRIHLALIRLGREICRPRNPRCSKCPLRKICRYAKSRGEEDKG